MGAEESSLMLLYISEIFHDKILPQKYSAIQKLKVASGYLVFKGMMQYEKYVISVRLYGK